MTLPFRTGPAGPARTLTKPTLTPTAAPTTSDASDALMTP
jgi:hypothetical protein